MSKSQKKKALKKSKKTEDKREAAFEIEELTEEVSSITLNKDEDTPHTNDAAAQVTSVQRTAHKKKQKKAKQPASTQPAAAPVTGEDPPESAKKENLKRVRALRKKLKQIDELEKRIASGDITSPEPEQLVKLAKKAELQQEYSQLTETSR